MTQPVRVFHVIDSVAVVVEIVDIRNSVVVVVLINCNLGLTIEQRDVRVVSIQWNRFTWQLDKTRKITLDAEWLKDSQDLDLQSHPRSNLALTWRAVFWEVRWAELVCISRFTDTQNVMSTFDLSKSKQNWLKKTNRHPEFHRHQNLVPDEKVNGIFWICTLLFLAILIFFDFVDKLIWSFEFVRWENILFDALVWYKFSFLPLHLGKNH